MGTVFWEHFLREQYLWEQFFGYLLIGYQNSFGNFFFGIIFFGNTYFWNNCLGIFGLGIKRHGNIFFGNIFFGNRFFGNTFLGNTYPIPVFSHATANQIPAAGFSSVGSWCKPIIQPPTRGILVDRATYFRTNHLWKGDTRAYGLGISFPFVVGPQVYGSVKQDTTRGLVGLLLISNYNQTKSLALLTFTPMESKWLVILNLS